MNRPASLATLAALALPALAGCSGTSEPPAASTAVLGPSTAVTAPAPGATVVRVTDGDTFVARVAGADVTIRILAINTPEVFGGVQCGGPEASAHAKTLLQPGRPVALAADPTQDDKDRYGRSLRYVTLEDGQDYGSLMVVGGYAKAYKLASGKPPQRYADYLAAEQAARAKHAGPLATCPAAA